MSVASHTDRICMKNILKKSLCWTLKKPCHYYWRNIWLPQFYKCPILAHVCITTMAAYSLSPMEQSWLNHWIELKSFQCWQAIITGKTFISNPAVFPVWFYWVWIWYCCFCKLVMSGCCCFCRCVTVELFVRLFYYQLVDLFIYFYC